MSDFNLDPSSLVLIQTSFSFIVAPFTAPTYNFPLFLFGFYATDKIDSNEPLRLFSGLLGLSALFDLIWLFRNDYNGLIGVLVFVNMLIKGPTFFSILVALRHRGVNFGALGRAAEQSFGEGPGETVFSVPGGFRTGAGKPGYSPINDDIEQAAPAPPPPSRQPRQPSAPAPGPSAVSHQAQVNQA